LKQRDEQRQYPVFEVSPAIDGGSLDFGHFAPKMFLIFYG
jgi:hypothetical protein